MKTSEDKDQQAGGELHVSGMPVGLGIAVGTIFVVVFCFILVTVYQFYSEHLVYTRVLSQPAADLQELREREKAALEAPASWVDGATGVVRIPVAHAMELMLEEARQGIHVLPAATATPEPAPPVPAPEQDADAAVQVEAASPVAPPVEPEAGVVAPASPGQSEPESEVEH